MTAPRPASHGEILAQRLASEPSSSTHSFFVTSCLTPQIAVTRAAQPSGEPVRLELGVLAPNFRFGNLRRPPV